MLRTAGEILEAHFGSLLETRRGGLESMGRRKQIEEFILPLGAWSRSVQDRSESETGPGGGRHNPPRPTRELLAAGCERVAVLLEAIAVIEAEMLTVACELGLDSRPGPESREAAPQEAPGGCAG